MASIQAEYPRPDHFILHLSDTHLVADGPLYGQVNSEARLRRIVDDLEASGARPEAMIFTGDLADKGEPAAYMALRDIVEAAADRIGSDVIWAMGNHDDRASLRTSLLDEPADTAPLDHVYDVNGLRVITVDTTVPGSHHGELDASQLTWLARQLDTAAPEGTILAMHHPPVPSVQDLAVLVELRGQANLAAVLRGTDVRSIIAGHLHYSTAATFAGIPVSVASATCYTQDLAGETGATRGRDGAQGYNLVHVYADTVVHSVVPPAGGPTVGEPASTAASRARLAAEGIVVPDAGAYGRVSHGAGIG